jgi:S1-C subfamily serine protease
MSYKEPDIENPYYYPYTPVPAPETPSYQSPATLPGAASGDVLQPPQYLPQEPLPGSVSPQGPRKQKQSGWRAGAIAALTLVTLLVFGVGLFAGMVLLGNHQSTSTLKASTTTTTTTNQTSQEAAIAKVEPAVVELKVMTRQGEAIGSGVIIDTKGDIVTNDHVVEGAQSLQAVLTDGTTETAQIVGTNTADDLAVVRIAPFAHMTVATLGNSSQLVVGQTVLAIGNPLGITQTVTNGIVSALNRTVPESHTVTIPNAIQTDAPINPGNSGGALINLQGEVIGIPTLTSVDPEFNTPASGVGFAIPSNLVKTDVAQILQQAS